MDFPKFLLEEKVNLPALKTFKARDGEGLSYRFYEGVDSDIVIICLHGSGSHGEYLHHLAKFFSKEIGQVIVPNLRGHFGSGKTAGDCTYIGQLEDDIMDLIRYLNLQGKKIYLLGHSSVGGLAIRLVGSKYRKFFAGTILLAPAIPTTPTMKKKSSWAEVSIFKIVLLSILNGFGIKKFNHLKVISFHMPREFRDGTETLSYTFNLNASYHPRVPYESEIRNLGDNYICFIGKDDELMEPLEFKKILNEDKIKIIENERHLSIVINREMMQTILKWLKKIN